MTKLRNPGAQFEASVREEIARLERHQDRMSRWLNVLWDAGDALPERAQKERMWKLARRIEERYTECQTETNALRLFLFEWR